MPMIRFLHRGERGAAALTVAIMMLLLMGVAALAIDGGRGMNERREAQNATDHAALIAAWTACQDLGDPIAAGLGSADENGFDNDGVTNTVTVAYEDDPATAEVEPYRYRATVQSILDGTFSAFVGADDFDVNTEAVAICSEIEVPGDYAIFAAAETCGPNELNLTGSSQTIIGGVHSNGFLQINGNAADPSNIHGPVSYVEGIGINGVNIWEDLPPGTIEGFPFRLDPQPAPVTFDVADYQPGGARAIAAGVDYHAYPGNEMWNGLNLPGGLYFVDGRLSMNDVTGEGVTIVATGTIDLTGTNEINRTDPPWDPDGLGLFSNRNAPTGACNPWVIRWSGSDHRWGGIQYAPYGLIQMSGASNSSFQGSIVAYRVDLSGANISITKSPLPDPYHIVTLDLEE
jgi:hypothetical protein